MAELLVAGEVVRRHETPAMRRAAVRLANLAFRRVVFTRTRKQAGQVLRRRENREYVTLYLKAFNAWATAAG